MKRLLAPALTLTLTLAACGSDDSDDASTDAPAATGNDSAAPTSTVNVMEIEGLGAVLAAPKAVCSTPQTRKPPTPTCCAPTPAKSSGNRWPPNPNLPPAHPT